MELNDILNEIEARAEKASPGPWTFARHWGPYNWRGAILHDPPGAGNCTVLPLETCTPEKDANGVFIAASRTDVPALVKALRRREEQLAGLITLAGANPELLTSLNREIAAVLKGKTP